MFSSQDNTLIILKQLILKFCIIKKFIYLKKFKLMDKNFSDVIHEIFSPVLPSLMIEDDDYKGDIFERKNKFMDDRKKIEDTSIYPYCFIGLLEMNKEKSHFFPVFGTAILISDNCLLTVAHNLKYDDNFEFEAADIKFYPGITKQKEMKNMPGYEVESIFVHNDYYDKVYECDVALLKLSQSIGIKIKQECKHDYLSFINNKDISNYKEIKIVGYPFSERDKEYDMYEKDSELLFHKINNRNLKYDEEYHYYYRSLTSKGQSGGPLLVKIDQDYKIIGIHQRYNEYYDLRFGIKLKPHLKIIENKIKEFEEKFVRLVSTTELEIFSNENIENDGKLRDNRNISRVDNDHNIIGLKYEINKLYYKLENQTTILIFKESEDSLYTYESLRIHAENRKIYNKSILVYEKFSIGLFKSLLGYRFFTNIEKLDLSHNNISSEDIKKYFKILSNFTNLAMLDLSYNNIGKTGIKKLSKSLENLKNLRWVDLSYNRIEESGAQKIEKCMDTMLNLKWVDMSCNSPIMNEKRDQLKYTSQLNKSMSCLVLTKNSQFI